MQVVAIGRVLLQIMVSLRDEDCGLHHHPLAGGINLEGSSMILENCKFQGVCLEIPLHPSKQRTPALHFGL